MIDYNTAERYKLIQKLEKGNYSWLERRERSKGGGKVSLGVLMVIIFGLALMSVIRSCDAEVIKPVKECSNITCRGV